MATIRVIDGSPHAYFSGLGLAPARGVSPRDTQTLEMRQTRALADANSFGRFWSRRQRLFPRHAVGAVILPPATGGTVLGSHLPDELLARRAAAGHMDAFEELLRRYRNRVYRICYRMAGNAEDADTPPEGFAELRVHSVPSLGHDPLGRYFRCRL